MTTELGEGFVLAGARRRRGIKRVQIRWTYKNRKKYSRKSQKGKLRKEVLKKQKRRSRKSVPSCEAGFFYGDFWEYGQSKEVLKKQKRRSRKSVPSCGAGFFFGDFWGCTRDLAEKSGMYERPGRKIRDLRETWQKNQGIRTAFFPGNRGITFPV